MSWFEIVLCFFLSEHLFVVLPLSFAKDCRVVHCIAVEVLNKNSVQKTSAFANGVKSLNVTDKPAVNGHDSQQTSETVAASETTTSNTCTHNLVALFIECDLLHNRLCFDLAFQYMFSSTAFLLNEYFLPVSLT